MDTEAGQATVQGITKSQTRLCDQLFHFYTVFAVLQSD